MEAYIIVSYWWGTHDDEPRYAEEKRIERLVVGSVEFARNIANEVSDKIKTEYGFCYVNIEEKVEVVVEGE